MAKFPQKAFLLHNNPPYISKQYSPATPILNENTIQIAVNEPSSGSVNELVEMSQ